MSNSVCQVKKDFRSACPGGADSTHQGRQYCILHLPSKEKNVHEFQSVVDKKLDTGTPDFAGAYFPSKANFRGRRFEKKADFSHAHFLCYYI